MFRYVSNHPKRKALPTLKNKQEFTPLTLAAKLGRKDLFEKMLEIRNIVSIIRNYYDKILNIFRSCLKMEFCIWKRKKIRHFLFKQFFICL